MFETLFSYPTVVRRHCEGPLAAERVEYLRALASRGMARNTILCRASYCLCVAKELERWPAKHCLSEQEIEALASTWAAERVASGRASASAWPERHFRFAATDFLRSLNRLRPSPISSPHHFHDELEGFIAAQQQSRWSSEATCRSARWQITRFLGYLEQRQLGLGELVPSHVDDFFQHMAQRWSRNSLRTSAKMLRAWFSHGERRGWVRAGLAQSILLPRIYRHEGLPMGPTWDVVSRVLTETTSDDLPSLRDHAIILLLSVYGLRSGEVRRLRIDDIDWRLDRLRLARSKSGQEEVLPIEPRVGSAIARYLRHGRPKNDSRVVFLTLRAPHRPLSAGGLYDVVHRHFSKIEPPQKGRGPHGLRHACARHLVESGHSFKETGDHLGHRCPDATRIYAKLDLNSLRRVAFEDLGGLA